MKNSEDSFVDQYIDDLVREEIKIEQEIFYENRSQEEKLSDQITAILSDELSKAIDREIVADMIEMGALKMSERINLDFDIKIMPRSKIEFLNIDVDIT